MIHNERERQGVKRTREKQKQVKGSQDPKERDIVAELKEHG